MSNKQVKTIEEEYQKLSLRDQIILRPDTYIGSVEVEEIDMWVAIDVSNPSETKIEKRKVKSIPGFVKIFDEILTNASDQVARDKGVKNIYVDIKQYDKDIKISISNDGDGIPIEIHKIENCYVPEMIFGHLLTGTNYNDNEVRFGGGRNGFGAKLTNIFSKEFKIKTYYKNKSYSQEWSNNMQKCSLPIVGKGKGLTNVTYIPDTAYFSKNIEISEIYEDFLMIALKRTLDIAAYCKDIKVYYNDTLLPVRNLYDYAKLHLNEENEIFTETINDRFDICIAESFKDNFEQVSIVNGISTHTGGTHINFIINQIVNSLIDEITKGNKKLKIKTNDVKSKLFLFLVAKIPNPTFDTQTKENLTTKMSKDITLDAIISPIFIKKLAKSSIVQSILDWLALKEAAELSKMSKLSGKKVKVAKLEDAYNAGTPKSGECALFLAEGDSAKASVISGFSVVGRDNYGVFPLKGKPLNVRKATLDKIKNNVEIASIMNAVGLVIGKKYKDKSELRYGKIVIMADGDNDGTHIKGLLINMFHLYWPELLEQNILYEFITPLIKCKKGDKVKDYYSIDEYKKDKNDNKLNNWTIKYYKGLGTITPIEIKEMFKNINKHLISFKYTDVESDNRIKLLFSDKREDDRKEWLLNYKGEIVPEKFGKQNKIDEFFDNEFIQFSMADNVRSIPQMMDGFKPSQRKVLYTCIKRNLVNEIKVAQLAGSVAEITAYHQGENSLNGAIIGMAQDFVGSNNIPLLIPEGQFGTRLQGGEDYASSRYIFTRLNEITRYIFRQEDDDILNYLDDDGKTIEPEFFVPIIPIILVNGCNGIGTGWSTDIRKYSIVGIIKVLEHKLTGGTSKYRIKPHYENFKGEINIEDTGRILTKGIYSITKDIVNITELPVEIWTNDYIEYLDKLVDEKIIKDYKNSSSDIKVDIKVIFGKGYTVKDSDILKLKLVNTLSTSNMHTFEYNTMKKYSSPEELLEVYYTERLKWYEKRKDNLLLQLKAKYVKANNTAKFITEVNSGIIKISNVSIDKINEQLVNGCYHKIDDSYTYLTNMPIYSLTKEKVENAIALRDKIILEGKTLKDKTIQELWLADLQELKDIIIKQQNVKKKK